MSIHPTQIVAQMATFKPLFNFSFSKQTTMTSNIIKILDTLGTFKELEDNTRNFTVHQTPQSKGHTLLIANLYKPKKLWIENWFLDLASRRRKTLNIIEKTQPSKNNLIIHIFEYTTRCWTQGGVLLVFCNVIVIVLVWLTFFFTLLYTLLV